MNNKHAELLESTGKEIINMITLMHKKINISSLKEQRELEFVLICIIISMHLDYTVEPSSFEAYLQNVLTAVQHLKKEQAKREEV
jgi:hypothetical protein